MLNTYKKEAPLELLKSLRYRIIRAIVLVDNQLVPSPVFIARRSSFPSIRFWHQLLKDGPFSTSAVQSLWYLTTFLLSPLSVLVFASFTKKTKVLRIDLSQIGSYLWLASLYGQSELNNDETSYVVCRPYIYTANNNALQSCISDDGLRRFTFARSLFMRFLYTSVSWNPHYSRLTTDLEYSKSNDMSLYEKYIARFIDRSKLLNSSAVASSPYLYRTLTESNASPNVTFCLRTSHFYGEKFASPRNVNPLSYLNVIIHLHGLGYNINFVTDPGHSLTRELGSRSIPFQVFLPGDGVRDILNLNCLINCTFLIGTSTGGSIVPLLAGRPVFFTNIHIPSFSPLKYSDCILTKSYYLAINNQRIQPALFDEYGLLDNFSVSDLVQKGILIKDNSPELLLRALLLFIDNLDTCRSLGDMSSQDAILSLKARRYSLQTERVRLHKVLKRFAFCGHSNAIQIQEMEN